MFQIQQPARKRTQEICRHQGKGRPIGDLFRGLFASGNAIGLYFRDFQDLLASGAGSPLEEQRLAGESRFVALYITLGLDRLVERVLQKTYPHLTVGIIHNAHQRYQSRQHPETMPYKSRRAGTKTSQAPQKIHVPEAHHQCHKALRPYSRVQAKDSHHSLECQISPALGGFVNKRSCNVFRGALKSASSTRISRPRNTSVQNNSESCSPVPSG